METRKRVLVVDDEKVINLTVRRMLEAEGYLVECAFDGHEALDKVRSFKPQAMVLDVMMPKENGYRVSRMIKTLGRNLPEGMVPKILLLTARRLDHDPTREDTMMEFSQADGVLYKPFDFKDLLAKLRSWTS